MNRQETFTYRGTGCRCITTVFPLVPFSLMILPALMEVRAVCVLVASSYVLFFGYCSYIAILITLLHSGLVSGCAWGCWEQVIWEVRTLCVLMLCNGIIQQIWWVSACEAATAMSNLYGKSDWLLSTILCFYCSCYVHGVQNCWCTFSHVKKISVCSGGVRTCVHAWHRQPLPHTHICTHARTHTCTFLTPWICSQFVL